MAKLSNITAIYGLFDTREPYTIWYVGKGLAKRAVHHWKEFLSYGTAQNAKQLKWFIKLFSEGIAPSWRFLEENVTDWQTAERKWIAYWREKNPDLCNVADGGNSWPLNSSQLGGLTAHKLYPNLAREMGLKGGRLGGKTTHKLYPNLAKEIGRRSAISGHLASIRTSDHQSKAGRIGGKRRHELHPESARKWGSELGKKYVAINGVQNGRIGGRKNVESGHLASISVLANHRRWHEQRGLIKEGCLFCLREKE